MIKITVTKRFHTLIYCAFCSEKLYVSITLPMLLVIGTSANNVDRSKLSSRILNEWSFYQKMELQCFSSVKLSERYSSLALSLKSLLMNYL